jgi:outer membrane lipoprotein-sorting protein
MSKLWLVLFAFTAYAQDARQIIAEMQRRLYTKSQRYEGTLEVRGGGSRVTTKRWMFQRTGSWGDSKSVLRFLAPPEVKDVGILIVNHPDRASDQWMWRPAIGREQRIALQDRSTRFFGTDFSFEDMEERDVNQADWKLLGEEGGAWKIEARPRKSSQYSHSLIWVRKDEYLLIKVEGYRKKDLVRRIEYSDYKKVQNVSIACKTEVWDASRNSRTILTFDKLEVNIPLKDEDFTLQALRRGSS